MKTGQGILRRQLLGSNFSSVPVCCAAGAGAIPLLALNKPESRLHTNCTGRIEAQPTSRCTVREYDPNSCLGDKQIVAITIATETRDRLGEAAQKKSTVRREPSTPRWAMQAILYTARHGSVRGVCWRLSPFPTWLTIAPPLPANAAHGRFCIDARMRTLKRVISSVSSSDAIDPAIQQTSIASMGSMVPRTWI